LRSTRRIMGRRVANALVTVFLVLLLNFVLFRVMPGNPINNIVPQNPEFPVELKEKLIEEHGLNDSWPVAFVKYVKACLTLNFGPSFKYSGVEAMDYVIGKLKWTMILTGTSSVLMVLIGMTIGIIAAWRRGGAFDTGSLAFSLFFYAMPTFWFAMMLIVVFATELQWFPSNSALEYATELEWTWTSFKDMVWHLVLPAASLTIGSIAAFSLIMRSSLVDVMTEEYITTARAKGLSEGRVLKDHAVPNAMLPMVALIAMDLAFVVGGAFQTEVVFSYPGIGDATVTATLENDWPVLQAAFFLIAVVVIFANLVADLLLVYLDPRVKIG
jgi:peptide/nickel transport system permease protein